MLRNITLAGLLACTAAVSPLQAAAPQETGTVIMRKTIRAADRPTGTNPGTPTTPGSPGSGQWRIGDWSWEGAEYCTEKAGQIRAVDCVSGGRVVADRLCVEAKPDKRREIPRTGGCYYNWKAGPWGDPVPACGETTQSRTMTCTRSDGSTAPEDQCTSVKGETTQASVDVSLCTNKWVVGAWEEWSSTCSSTATRQRQVLCERSDGAPDSEDKCKETKPDAQETSSILTGCDYAWKMGEWTNDGPGCGEIPQTRTVNCLSAEGKPAEEFRCVDEKPQAQRVVTKKDACESEEPKWAIGEWSAVAPSCGPVTQTRTLTCIKGNGVPVNPGLCKDKPADSQTVDNFDGCRSTWETGRWTDWNDTCSASASRTRSVACMRSDGAISPGTACAGDQPLSSDVQAVFSGCSYEWNTGEWTKNVGCGKVRQTRDVECRRSDSTKVDDAFCTGARPDHEMTVDDHQTCGYSTVYGEWSDWTSTCSKDATRTRKATCMREDGVVALPQDCKDAQLPLSEKSDVYSGCSFEWVDKGPAPIPATCGDAVATTVYACRRSDGTEVPDASCPQPKPSKTTPTKNYDACTFEWAKTEWSAWTSTCAKTATRFRTVTCLRADGETVQIGCSGEPPKNSESAEIYSGCSFKWEPGPWISPSFCGPVTQNRTVTCLRGDGVTVDDASCAGAGVKPALQQQGTDYRSCTYAWNPGTWSAYNSSCSSTATRTRAVDCQRSDKTNVGPELCAGVAPDRTETKGIYTGCTYKWTSYPWEPSSTCSESQTETRKVECTRVDDLQTVMPDASCSAQGAKPITSQTQANYSGCGTALVNGGFETGLTNWNSTQPISIATNIVHGGSKSIRMDPSGQLRQTIQTIRNKNYTLSYWAYTRNGIYMNSYGPQGKIIENRGLPNSGYQWVFFSGTFVGTGNLMSLGFYHYSPNGGESYLDDVVIN